MEVSFTGINNLYLAKRALRPNEIQGLTHNGEQELKYGIVTKLKAKLSDDHSGKDLSDFIKLQTRFNHGYVNPQAPDTVELETLYSVIDNDITNHSIGSFKLNGRYINISENKDFALFDYIAKLTRQIFKKPELSQERKDLVKFMNDVIDASAKSFLE